MKKVTINYQIDLEDIPKKVAELIKKDGKFGIEHCDKFLNDEKVSAQNFLEQLLDARRSVLKDLEEFSSHISLLGEYIKLKGQMALDELSQTDEVEESKQIPEQPTMPEERVQHLNNLMLKELNNLNLPEDQREMYLQKLKEWNEKQGFEFDIEKENEVR